MKSLINSRQGLTGVDVCAGRNPYCLKAWVIEHLVVATVDGDVKVFVVLVFFCPSDFVLKGAAYCDYSRTRDSVKKGMDVSLALTAS